MVMGRKDPSPPPPPPGRPPSPWVLRDSGPGVMAPEFFFYMLSSRGIFFRSPHVSMVKMLAI